MTGRVEGQQELGDQITRGTYVMLSFNLIIVYSGSDWRVVNGEK